MLSTGKIKKVLIRKEERKWTTRDGLSIASNFLSSSWTVGARHASPLIILAPGFGKYKDAYPMTELCEELTSYGDVLCLDFRGVGKSEGRYTFGGKEYLDLEPLLKWGRENYQQVVLLGLSLGSYHSLRAAHAWPELVDKLLLVSCPSQLEDVLKTLGPIRQGYAIASDWKALRKRLGIEFSLFFRWGNPFSAKPNASHLAPGLRVPTAFLVGGKDRLVVKSLSRKVFENMPEGATWTEIPEGNHAEFLYLENHEKFWDWVSASINYLGRTHVAMSRMR